MNIYHLVSNKVWGGGEQYVLDLACRQRDAGHYVEIVCRNEPEVIAPFRAKEFPISTLPLKGLTDLDSGVRLARMVKKRRNTVITLSSWPRTAPTRAPSFIVSSRTSCRKTKGSR